jgi:hypothetical protein
VGNASPAEAPGQTAEQYAQAAEAERAKGNQDTAARLTVQATEAQTAQDAAQGTPQPTTPLAPVSSFSSIARKDTGELPTAQGGHGASQYPWSWAVSKGGAPAPEAAGDIRNMDKPELYNPLEQPPAYKAPDKGVSFFALALDALLNKGRNAGRLVGQLAEGDDAYINYARKTKAAKDAADIEATKRRGVGNPFDEYYRRKRLELAEDGVRLREDQIKAQGETTKLRASESALKTDANHPMAQKAREIQYAQGVAPGTLDGLSYEALKPGLSEAQRNMIEVGMSDQMAGVAADKAKATAEATEGSKIRVAEGISDATQANKIELAQASAATQAGAREEAAILDETKDINAKRRIRAVARTKEREKLESLLARLESKDPAATLPKQGHIIERGAVTFKAELLGGTGLSEEDSILDNDLTMAGLQNYIGDAANAPNSLPEQTESGRKFRGNGTYGGAAMAVRKRLAEMDSGESKLREEEDATRIRPTRKPTTRPKAQPAPEDDDLPDEVGEDAFR